jgi:hypothetical protein
LPVICSFFIFMLCHRFAHMGYVRIMTFFTLVTFVIIGFMGYYTKSLGSQIQKGMEADSGKENSETLINESMEPAKDPSPKQEWKSIHETISTETVMLCSLQFAMFFVCYGVARMICQPWMWELHFWPVFCLTCAALFSAFLFVWLVSPAIPNFCAAMAMPPHYVDPDNLRMMRQVAASVNRKAQGLLTPGRQSS